jgi:hypothetical protein
MPANLSLRSSAMARLARIGGAIGLLGPLIILLLRQFAYLDGRDIPCCDYAVLELGSRAFVRGEQFTGLYSRQGWRHPGPAPFLWQLPFKLLPGDSFAEYRIATVALAILAIGVALWFFHDRLPTRAFLGACVVFGLWMVRFDIRFMLEPWNPFFAMYWVLAFVPCAAMFDARGSGRWLVAAAVTGSMAVQCHLGAAPVVIIGLGTAIWCAWRRREERSVRIGAIAALGATLALWLLPLIDLAFGDRNLWHILTVDDSASGASFSWGSMLRGIVQILSLGPARQGYRLGPASPFLSSSGPDAWMIIAAILGIALGAYVIVRRDHHRRLAFAVAVSGAGLVATGLSLAASGGEFFPYLVLPVVALGPIIWACGIAAVVTDLPVFTSRIGRPLLVGIEIVVIAAVACVLVSQIPTTAEVDVYSTADLRSLTAQVEDNCAAVPSPALVYIDPAVEWTDAITIVAAIDHCAETRVYGYLGWVAGEPYVWHEGDDANLLIMAPATPAPAGTVVAQSPGIIVSAGPFQS